MPRVHLVLLLALATAGEVARLRQANAALSACEPHAAAVNLSPRILWRRNVRTACLCSFTAA